MNTFLDTLKEVCGSILPLLGVVAVVLLIVLLIYLIKAVKSANIALKKGSGTIDLVDESIKKIQSPLDTAVKVSETIDKAHDATIKGIDEAKEYIGQNAKAIKAKLTQIVNSKNDQTKMIKEPKPEDIIGGK